MARRDRRAKTPKPAPQPETAPPPPAGPQLLPTLHKRVALGLLLVIYLVVGSWFQLDFGEIMGYYTMFAEGLSDGNLHIRPTPDQVNLVDMIPFNGHYYLQWGPFPGLLHLAPMLIGMSLSDRLATILATWLGAWILLAILELLAERHFPKTPRWVFFAFFFAYALATPAALLAYRGTVYNESISIGATCVLFAFYALLRGQREVGALWPSLSGLALAAAVTTRVTLALYAAVFALGWAARAWRRHRKVADAAAPVVAYCAPIALGVALMLAYNAARFGSPFDYGNSYKPGDTSHFAPFSLARVPENLGHYLFSAPTFHGDFPWMEHQGNQPIERVSRAEAMSSILVASPFFLLAFWPVAAAVRKRDLDDLTVAVASAALGPAGMFAVLMAFAAASRRYVQDFSPLLTVLAFLGAAMFIERREGKAPAWALPVFAVVIAGSALLHMQITFVQSFRTPTPDVNITRLLTQIGPTLRSIAPGPELNREEAIAHNDWASILLNQRRYQEAAAELRIAAELMPDSELIRKNLDMAEKLVGGGS